MSLGRLIDGFARWLDTVAGVIAAALARCGRGSAVRIAQASDGSLYPRPAGAANTEAAMTGSDAPLDEAAIRGRDVELVLHRGQVLFRPLELPQAAAGFLDGIVRAQIDRLTPWSAEDAAYGWTPPREIAGGRIGILVAATARARLSPCLDRLKALGARSVAVVIHPPTRHADVTDDGPPIALAGPAGAQPTGAGAVRRALFAGVAAAAVAATLGVAASELAGGLLDAEREGLEEQIAARRRVLMASRDGGGAAALALQDLERRKHGAEPVVLVLETLSRLLPDHTYLTTLEIEGDRLQIMGLSREAPALIRLLEQSARFSEATFAAPTTRQGSDDGERFHIEARLRASPEPRR